MDVSTPWQASLPPSPLKKPYCCQYMCKPTLLSRKPPLATPLRQAKQTTKNGRTTLQNTPDRHSTRRSQTGTQGPGASYPFHHNRETLVQAILHRTLPPVPKSLRGPVCPHSTYVIRNIETSIKPMALCAMGSHKQTLITALKKRLEQAKGKWVEELPGVLWAYRTTPGRPTGNTPFALTYGMGAVIPTEIGLPTIWTEASKQDDANTKLGRNLDWANKVRESAVIRMADYQQKASAHYNRKVRPKSFKNGTMVLRKVFENTTEKEAGKFQANWKGPYIVSKSSESGAYHLQKLDGTPLLRPWNMSNLKQYYQ
ncbi:hypothetical protein CK203_079490 [Vitis vinifera]|uniref:Uncharacterized protein n=1 Tax=Vitis vinifera TaxID=29760 RepID=A0A438CNT5_VITVI|nr:hypothetical protein CK203_079490 [Vitis vinifera]